MDGRPATDDPYDVGREWRVDDFAAQWNIDGAKLRRALNLCAFGMELPVGRQSAAQRREELNRIADTGKAFARALAEAGDDTTIFLLVTPPELHNDLMLNPHKYRQSIANRVQRMAEKARHQADLLRVTKKPTSSMPTRDEREVVSEFAVLWHQTNGGWPNVTPRKGGQTPDHWAANEAGRFVIAAAAEYFSISLTDQRLRTVLRSIKAPTTQT